ncbi:MAG: PAS domain S-box protein [Spirochaetota bacterium]|nr:PAS domain S-box protein [Spirochaetota bacterium]
MQIAENDYRKLIENSPVMIAVHNGNNFLYVNPAGIKLLGATSFDDLVNKPLSDFIHFAYWETENRILNQLQPHENTINFIEQKFIRLDKEIVDVEVIVSSIDFENQSAVQIVVIDISKRKEVEVKLKISEKRIKRLFDYTPEAIYICDLKGNFVDGNRALEKLSCYTKEELIGKNFLKSNLIPAEQNLKMAKLLAKNSLEQLTDTEEFTLNRKDGKKINLEIRTIPIRIKSKAMVLGVARDITERKQAEEKQAKLLKELKRMNKELEDFAYIVSHDLKAPLSTLTLQTKLLSIDYFEILDSNGKELIKSIIDGINRMHDLITGIFQFALIGLIKEEVDVDLNKIFIEVIEMLAPAKNIEIIVEKTLPVVSADRTRMIQLFQNLLSNAIKFQDKPNGEIKIDYTIENNFWKFKISDNGMGIEKKNHKKIFQMFQSLDSNIQHDSAGIGLSVVSKIVEIYGGKVWVESKLGVGSTFYFTLLKKDLTKPPSLQS